MRPPTTRELDLVCLVRERLDQYGQSPSTPEIAEHFGFSQQRASRLIKQCARKGLLVHQPHFPRGLSLPDSTTTTGGTKQ